MVAIYQSKHKSEAMNVFIKKQKPTTDYKVVSTITKRVQLWFKNVLIAEKL